MTGKKPLRQRTCVACRQIKSKRDLVRVVRVPGGEIEIDETGKRDGRGAYLCPNNACMNKALKGNQLEHTLKSSITEENRRKLIEHLKGLLEGTD